MASSKVVSTNPDLPRASSTSSSLSSFLLSDLPPNTMDDLLKSIYTPNKQDIKPPSTNNNIDDVWKDIVVGNIHPPPSDEQITLEDFLTKAGAVRGVNVNNVDVNVNVNVMSSSHFPPLSIPPPSTTDVSSAVQPSVTVVKGKRRVVDEPVDKATLQKQRRMIKNRESAARSRERKQAYTSELESLVQQLEEENARLLKEQAERNRQRLKELREGLVPVADKSKQKRKLRRSNSAQTL